MKHTIADSHLVEGDTWVLCTCGERVTDASAETINEPFQSHRVAAGETRRTFAVSDYRPAEPILLKTRITIVPSERRKAGAA